MAIVTGYTAAKMNEFGNASVISGTVNSAGALILKTRGGSNIDAGNVKGAKGDVGPVGITGGPTAARNAAFPLPTSVAASVTLANKVVTWYNTTTGIIETYYAKSGSAGLLVPGVPGAYGWYENKHLADSPKGVIAEQYAASSTPRIESSTSSWVVTDNMFVDLVEGRRYKVWYKITTIAASANMALGMRAYTSIVTDTKPNSGTMVEEEVTIYAAPGTFQGSMSIVELVWTAPTTGRFNLKMCALRATLSGIFYFEKRRLRLYDEGSSEALVPATPL